MGDLEAIAMDSFQCAGYYKGPTHNLFSDQLSLDRIKEGVLYRLGDTPQRVEVIACSDGSTKVLCPVIGQDGICNSSPDIEKIAKTKCPYLTPPYTP